MPHAVGTVTRAGQLASEFELPDSTGATRGLSELTADGPVVLLFYRGYW
jgi:thioredoxin-dependent peroxiredoxin